MKKVIHTTNNNENDSDSKDEKMNLLNKPAKVAEELKESVIRMMQEWAEKNSQGGENQQNSRKQYCTEGSNTS